MCMHASMLSLGMWPVMPKNQEEGVAQMRCCAKDKRRVHTNVAMDNHHALALIWKLDASYRCTCDSAALRARLLVPGLAGGGDYPRCPALPGAAYILCAQPSIPYPPGAHPPSWALGQFELLEALTLPGLPIGLACPAKGVLVDRIAQAAILGAAHCWLLVCCNMVVRWCRLCKIRQAALASARLM